MAVNEMETISTDKAQFLSDSETDLEDDRFSDDPIENSSDLAKHDNDILAEEDEREELLTRDRNGHGSGDKHKSFWAVRSDSQEKKSLRREARRSKRRKSRRTREKNDEEGELMFEMEEGGPKSDTSSQASSSSIELDKTNLERPRKSKRRRRLLCSCIGLSIVAFFLVITLGAYKISHEVDMPPHLKMFSNGTAQFAPTTILISLDGFRADFLKRGITPTLNQFISEGISPRFMLPSFPSVTFPNHYTLVTGLYPESHGVVGNTFWDPDMKKEFYYTDPNRSMQPYWWSQGQPLWVTAEEQKVTAAVHMWPGSEAGMEFGASYVDKFNGTEALARKTRRIMEFVDIPFTEDAQTTRPQLIAAYVPNVDSDGHKFGPNSTEIWDTISAVDSMLHDIFIGLEERNLTEIVNVVVVSDHGMATTSTERTVQVEDFVDLDLVEHIDGWPHWGLRPKNPADLQTIHDQIVERKGDDSAFDVYLRDENMPERYHFSNNDRIAPLWMIPKTGWAIVKKEEFNVEQAKASGEVYHPKGIHGYDHEHPLMRAIFVARGPAFPHKPNSRVENFQNTEVYNIVCDSLGIKPKANNGTLRLPLKPVGLHSDISDPETPADPPSPSSTADFEQGPEDEQTMGHTSESESNDSQASDENESTKAYNNYWAYMKAKMKAAMAWANKVISGLKKSNKSVGGNDQDS